MLETPFPSADPRAVGSFASPGARKSALAGSARADRPGLGKRMGPVDPEARKLSRLARKASRRKAASLLGSLGETHAMAATARAIRGCGERAFAPEVTLERNDRTGVGRFAGLRRCGRSWLCPDCTRLASMARKVELDAALAGARAKGFSVCLLTLTAAHAAADGVAFQMETLKKASKLLKQRREWRALPLVGVIVATEVTFGNNGPHLHTHTLVIMDCPEPEALNALDGLRAAWLVCLARFGRSGNKAALHVSGGSDAGTYCAKFGLGDEMALGPMKSGRGASRTIWQVLRDAASGCARSAAIWLAAAPAFLGRKQLTWSPGLKAVLGVTDAVEVEGDGADDPGTFVVVRAWLSRGDGLRLALQRSAALLDACEGDGSGLDLQARLSAALAGPSDAARWREHCGDGQLFERVA